MEDGRVGAWNGREVWCLLVECWEGCEVYMERDSGGGYSLRKGIFLLPFSIPLTAASLTFRSTVLAVSLTTSVADLFWMAVDVKRRGEGRARVRRAGWVRYRNDILGCTCFQVGVWWDMLVLPGGLSFVNEDGISL
jgi:hypothetical protein